MLDVFITGSQNDTGKTIVTAGLAATMQSLGYSTGVYAPVQKGGLAKDGYSEAYGARPLRRLIQRKIEDMLAEEILSGKYLAGDTIKLVMNEDKIVCEKASKKKSKAKEEAEQVIQ